MRIVIGIVVFFGTAWILSQISFMHRTAIFGMTFSLLCSIALALFAVSRVK